MRIAVEPELLPDGTVIRQAEAKDLSQLLELLHQLHTDDALLTDTSQVRAVYEQMCSDDRRSTLVAARKNRLVGTLDFFVLDNLTRGGRPWGGIENLVVDASERRHGYGRALIVKTVDLAVRLGCYKIQLVSHASRYAAHELYSRTGFDAPVRGYRLYL